MAVSMSCVFAAIVSIAFCKSVKHSQVPVEENFFIVREGLERQFLLSYNGYLASDKSFHDGYSEIMYRQVTDGSSLYEGVFDENGSLRDCEMKRRRHDVNRFVREFQRDMQEEWAKSQNSNSTTTFTPLTEGEIAHEVLVFIDGMTNFQQLQDECRNLHTTLNEEHRQKRALGIYPGTKWCGSGSTAKHENDFGPNIKTDKCCKKHDRCPKSIGGFQTKWHLFNYWFGTVSHCDCDNSFKTCLQSAKTSTANMIGRIFFNLIQRDCFVLEEKEVCTERSWWGRCVKRERTLVGRFTESDKFVYT